jgi:hypothetical protein
VASAPKQEQRDRALHVDRYAVDPLSGTRRFLGRLAADDPSIGAQEREGSATYVEVSEPHAMADCPEGGKERRG